MQEQQKQQKNPATLGALNQVGSNSSIITIIERCLRMCFKSTEKVATLGK